MKRREDRIIERGVLQIQAEPVPTHGLTQLLSQLGLEERYSVSSPRPKEISGEKPRPKWAPALTGALVLGSLAGLWISSQTPYSEKKLAQSVMDHNLTGPAQPEAPPIWESREAQTVTGKWGRMEIMGIRVGQSNHPKRVPQRNYELYLEGKVYPADPDLILADKIGVRASMGRKVVWMGELVRKITPQGEVWRGYNMGAMIPEGDNVEALALQERKIDLEMTVFSAPRDSQLRLTLQPKLDMGRSEPFKLETDRGRFQGTLRLEGADSHGAERGSALGKVFGALMPPVVLRIEEEAVMHRWLIGIPVLRLDPAWRTIGSDMGYNDEYERSKEGDRVEITSSYKLVPRWARELPALGAVDLRPIHFSYLPLGALTPHDEKLPGVRLNPVRR